MQRMFFGLHIQVQIVEELKGNEFCASTVCLYTLENKFNAGTSSFWPV